MLIKQISTNLNQVSYIRGEVNSYLQHIDLKSNQRDFVIKNPLGNHALCAGLQDEIKVTIKGHVGYYCAGMNKNAEVTIEGNGATGQGGTLVIDGDASSRCGISMKGINIIVKGSVGHMSAFMAQSGNLVILGDADEYLGDSIYEAKIYCLGKVKSLGAGCIEKEMNDKEIKHLSALLEAQNIKADPKKFKRYGSARSLYNFKIDNVSSY